MPTRTNRPETPTAAPTADGVHLLGPLASKVIRIAPPLVITPAEAAEALAILDRAAARLLETT